MKVNFRHIILGWGKATGLLQKSKAETALSVARLEVCAECVEAKESSILKIIQGSAHTMGAIYCNLCKCPCNEKSLVAAEKCPLQKWNTSALKALENDVLKQ